MAAVASSASWAPSSPRLSFSRDFVQSEVFSPSPSSLVDASQDFDFGMLALPRMGDPDAASPMLPADELRLIAKDLPAEKSPGAVVMAVATTAKKQVQKPEQRRDPPHASQSSPITSSRRWGELFSGGHRAPRSSSASMSELEQPLAAASAMAPASSPPPSPPRPSSAPSSNCCSGVARPAAACPVVVPASPAWVDRPLSPRLPAVAAALPGARLSDPPMHRAGLIGLLLCV